MSKLDFYPVPAGDARRTWFNSTLGALLLWGVLTLIQRSRGRAVCKKGQVLAIVGGSWLGARFDPQG